MAFLGALFFRFVCDIQVFFLKFICVIIVKGTMPEQRQLINYKGILTFSTISQLLNELKDQMDLLGEKLATYKRVLIIMVEVLENIHKYIESQQGTEDVSRLTEVDFQLVKVGDKFLIKSTNLVRAEAQKRIQDKVDLINRLDHDELKGLYRQIISNGQFTKEGGAGLGFIEIAKTSQNRINYSFEKVDDSFVYYTINLELTS